MKKLKVGVIGLGVGTRHIEAYDAHPYVEIAALCDFDTLRIKEIGEKYPQSYLTEQADQILEDSSIDLVSIASYDNYHYDQIKKAFDNDKHVYVEKPMCLFVHEAQNIRRLLNSKINLRLSSNLTLRTCPRFIRLKKAIKSGEMGNIYSIQADYLWGRVHKLTTGWRKDMSFYSIIYGACIHMIDLVIWLTGMLPVEVQGYGNQLATKNAGTKYNDFAVMLLKFNNDLVVEITAHGGCVHPHFHQLQVYGTKKTFINSIAGGWWIDSNNPDAQIINISEEYPGKAERREAIKSFVDSILNKTNRPIITTDDVFNSMSVCFATEQAINTNRNIRIDYI